MLANVYLIVLGFFFYSLSLSGKKDIAVNGMQGSK